MAERGPCRRPNTSRDHEQGLNQREEEEPVRIPDHLVVTIFVRQSRSNSDTNYEGVVSGAASALIDNLTSPSAPTVRAPPSLSASPPRGAAAGGAAGGEVRAQTPPIGSTRINGLPGTSTATREFNRRNHGFAISPPGGAGEPAAAANYTDLPPLRSPGGGDNSLSQYNGARPRFGGVRRSHTSPDSLFVISRTSPTPLVAASARSTSAPAQENVKSRSLSMRKNLDSFLKATRRRFNRKSRPSTSTCSAETSQGESQSSDKQDLTSEVSQIRVAVIEPAANPNPHQAGLPSVIVGNMGPRGLAQHGSDEFEDAVTSMPHIRAHTTVDYVHCLVPDLAKVTNCSFYWGVMDRYEAEALLDNKPEGTFLLRDSSQDDFIFSVSFRRYGRSLHARVEQWNHMFSFDAHDSGVYKAPTVTTLIEHYKDPQTCMFFEPMLTRPLNRPQVFSLLHLARGVVCDNTNYDSIDHLNIPKNLQEYLRYYHYKQKVRVRTHSNSREFRPPRPKV